MSEGIARTPAMTLDELLELHESSPGVFDGVCEPSAPARAFGGQVAAQALMAAGGTTAPDRLPHSAHAYFVRKGNPRRRINYHVDIVRDGLSFSNRYVRAVQDDQLILHLTASFHRPEPGPQHGAVMPTVAAPELVPSIEDWYNRHREQLDPRFVRYWSRHPIELRFVEAPPQVAAFGGARPARQRVWIRATDLPPSSHLFHTAALVYGTDLVALGTVLLPHGVPGSGARVLVTSLDHALWFHDDLDLSEWHLLDLSGPVAARGRGLASGAVFSRDGRCVATLAQEGLIRTLSEATVRSPFDVVGALPDLG